MKSKMIAIPAVAMLLLANGSVQAASLRPTTTTGVLEGFVRDQYGKPVKGARVWVNQGSYTTQGRTGIIPIFIPKLFIGAMVFDDPNAVQNHVINGHRITMATTLSRGSRAAATPSASRPPNKATVRRGTSPSRSAAD